MKITASVALERCTDCRKICTCYGDCVCSYVDAETRDLVCNDCGDARDAR